MRSLQFQSVLGAGAFGTVYRAVLEAPGGFAHVVAVKVLREVMDGAACARVRDEARLLGRLVDPRIAGVREVARVEGRDAILLPLVEGVDLAQLLSEGPVPPRAVAELGAELGGALASAHAATDPGTGGLLAVVHRDVKPANVRIGESGNVTLLDFGVAHARFLGRESRTGSQEVLGSPAWMAPEYLREGRLGPEVDVYALGVVLLEAATGQRLGKPRTDPELHRARVDALCEALGSARPLEGALRRAVAANPSERLSSLALSRALASLADSMTGPGLRTWAIPAVARARAKAPALPDPLALLGRTIRLDLAGDAAESAPTVMIAAPPPPLAARPAPETPAPVPPSSAPPRPAAGYAMLGAGLLLALLALAILLSRSAP
jgi:serine/threonine protein kinase